MQHIPELLLQLLRDPATATLAALLALVLGARGSQLQISMKKS